MKQLLNTLFVTSEDIYLSLDGENVVANRGGEAVARYPLHTLQSIVSFSYAGASPALMGACAQREIALAFCSPRGKFLARVAGQAQGNVLLRRMQYRVADDPSQSCRVAGMMIFGKVYNAKWSVERTRRDHAMRIDESRFSAVSDQLQGLLPQIAAETSLDSLRGLEGVGAAAYFSVLDDMILQGKETFFFRERSRRPPCHFTYCSLDQKFLYHRIKVFHFLCPEEYFFPALKSVCLFCTDIPCLICLFFQIFIDFFCLFTELHKMFYRPCINLFF